MDALGHYGSDDDSSSDGGAPAADEKSSALAGLMYSSDEEDVSDKDKAATKSQQTKLTDSSSNRKRKRSFDNKSAPDAATNSNTEEGFVLPPPPLSDSSLLQWNVDYTEKYRRVPKGSPSPQLVEKLKLLYEKSSQDHSTNFAQQLKSQKEFHNPHFFDNVVSHFGIKDPLGSTVATRDFEAFEYNVVQAEEQARIRQANQHQNEMPTT